MKAWRCRAHTETYLAEPACRTIRGHRLCDKGILDVNPVQAIVAAISVGIVDGQILLDLDYEEDSRADVDLNVAMSDKSTFVEIQGTAEGQPFSRTQLDDLLDLAAQGIGELFRLQRASLRHYSD